MKSLYFDYAATTPVDPRVLEAMLPYMSGEFGNPGSLHSFGQRASAAVFASRQKIAKTIGAHYSEIFFTASATEANNLAIRGAILYFQKKHPGIKPRILIPETEHDCVLATAKGATELGAEVVYLPVNKDGFLKLDELKKNLNGRTILVSIMYANNEIGVIQPIPEISRIIRDFKKSTHKTSRQSVYPLLHTDAVQAFEYLDCDVAKLGVDMLTLSGHKIYGPKGVGALYIKNRQLGARMSFKNSEDKYLIRPFVLGGGQEEGMRSGTENVPAIVGFGVAAEIASASRTSEAKRLVALRDKLLKNLKALFPKLAVNGSMKVRLPNHLSIYVPGITAERALAELDLAGISISSGSACSARTPEPSKVLTAMGMRKDRTINSLRITLGRQTTAQDVSMLVRGLRALRA